MIKSFYQAHHLCADDLECDVDNGGCDQICINTIGNFHCNCTEGYLLNEDGFSCDGESIILPLHSTECSLNIADIDECLSSPCHPNATCNNTDGSFTCACVGGYSGDGFQCIGEVDVY